MEDNNDSCRVCFGKEFWLHGMFFQIIFFVKVLGLAHLRLVSLIPEQLL